MGFVEMLLKYYKVQFLSLKIICLPKTKCGHVLVYLGSQEIRLLINLKQLVIVP